MLTNLLRRDGRPQGNREGMSILGLWDVLGVAPRNFELTKAIWGAFCKESGGFSAKLWHPCSCGPGHFLNCRVRRSTEIRHHVRLVRREGLPALSTEGTNSMSQPRNIVIAYIQFDGIMGGILSTEEDMFAIAPARNWRFDNIVYRSCCARN